jgi:hypothetical protein
MTNCITFNGIITTDLIKLNEEEFGFVLRGENNEEFPLMVVFSKEKPDLLKGDKISGVGILIKKNDWRIETTNILRIPTEKEFSKLN